MKKIYCFDKNDKIRIKKLNTTPERQRFYEAFGIFEDAEAIIFFKNQKNLILKIGAMKLALSAEAAKEILAEKII